MNLVSVNDSPWAPIANIVAGAVQKKISQKNINSLILQMPDPGSVIELEGLFAAHRNNVEENAKIGGLRDALLPKRVASEFDAVEVGPL